MSSAGSPSISQELSPRRLSGALTQHHTLAGPRGGRGEEASHQAEEHSHATSQGALKGTVRTVVGAVTERSSGTTGTKARDGAEMQAKALNPGVGWLGLGCGSESRGGGRSSHEWSSCGVQMVASRAQASTAPSTPGGVGRRSGTGRCAPDPGSVASSQTELSKVLRAERTLGLPRAQPGDSGSWRDVATEREEGRWPPAGRSQGPR